MGIADNHNDEAWMRHAFRLAQRAEGMGEVPVGAVIVKDGVCIAEGWNRPIASHDPSAHAEMLAIREAGNILKNYRLTGTTLYVTLEPCVMCMGAIVHARIERLVFAAEDPKRGAVCSAINLSESPILNHRVAWRCGVLKDECSEMLKDFFRARR
ncbi:tRNA adenosine(34) deaminase TadA [Methylotuvimicrobium sp. KM2]|uniref:tRNA adenosine(34) deaminase TadA n=1 Tax=Methylotuvimicrobium sp. KM2 TaxID=3133976 RepID=UPI00310132F5